VFFLVWLAFFGGIFVFGDDRPTGAFAVIFTLMLVYALVMAVRVQRMAVTADGDELVVRNQFRSRRIPRADITGFSTGRYQRIGQRTAYADLRDGGSVRLMALELQFPTPGRERAIEPTLDRLEAWRTGSTLPA
jgi:hypothetical protein